MPGESFVEWGEWGASVHWFVRVWSGGGPEEHGWVGGMSMFEREMKTASSAASVQFFFRQLRSAQRKYDDRSL